MEPTGPCAVVGSTQRSLVDVGRAAGVPTVRRRSGGGVVWVDPATCGWLDVFVPRDDPLWRADVGAAFDWLGELFATVLGARGVDCSVHSGPYERGPDEGMVCFAGRGRGEVLVGGRKLVGIAQRRTRAGARLGAVWYSVFDVAPLVPVVGEAVAERAAGLGVGLDASGDGRVVPWLTAGEMAMTIQAHT